MFVYSNSKGLDTPIFTDMHATYMYDHMLAFEKGRLGKTNEILEHIISSYGLDYIGNRKIYLVGLKYTPAVNISGDFIYDVRLIDNQLHIITSDLNIFCKLMLSAIKKKAYIPDLEITADLELPNTLLQSVRKAYHEKFGIKDIYANYNIKSNLYKLFTGLIKYNEKSIKLSQIRHNPDESTLNIFKKVRNLVQKIDKISLVPFGKWSLKQANNYSVSVPNKNTASYYTYFKNLFCELSFIVLGVTLINFNAPVFIFKSLLIGVSYAFAGIVSNAITCYENAFMKHGLKVNIKSLSSKIINNKEMLRAAVDLKYNIKQMSKEAGFDISYTSPDWQLRHENNHKSFITKLEKHDKKFINYSL